MRLPLSGNDTRQPRSAAHLMCPFSLVLSNCISLGKEAVFPLQMFIIKPTLSVNIQSNNSFKEISLKSYVHFTCICHLVLRLPFYVLRMLL